MNTLLQIKAIITRLKRARDTAPNSQFIQQTTFRILAVAGELEASFRRQEADAAKVLAELAGVTEKIEQEALTESKR